MTSDLQPSPDQPEVLEEIKHDGKPYLLLYAAAKRAQVPVGTLVRWAEAGVTNFGMQLALVRDPATQALYLGEETIAALANRFQPVDVTALQTQRSPPRPPPPPLEWKPTTNPKFVEYGGKTYVVQARALRGLGLRGKVLRNILSAALTPDGGTLDMLQERSTKARYFSLDTVDRLKRRWVYADTKESLGPCTFRREAAYWKSPASATDKHLVPVQSFKAEFCTSLTDGRNLVRLEQFSQWIREGKGPDGFPVRQVLDTLTGEELLTVKTAHAIVRGFCETRPK